MMMMMLWSCFTSCCTACCTAIHEKSYQVDLIYTVCMGGSGGQND